MAQRLLKVRLVVAIFFLVSIHAMAQTPTAAPEVYFVQQVSGDVKVNGVKLIPNTKLTQEEKLIFSKGAKLLVSSQQHGRIVLCQNPKTVQSEIEYTLAALLPHTRQLSTRGSDMINNRNDFKAFFGEEHYVVVGDELKLVFNQDHYKIDVDHFFYVSYKSAQEKQINKRLYTSGDTLLFRKDSLFTVDKKLLPDYHEAYDMNLFYYDQMTGQSVKLSPVQLYFLDDDVLKANAKDILKWSGWSATKTRDNYDALQASFSALIDARGRNNLSQWLTRSLGIHKPGQ